MNEESWNLVRTKNIYENIFINIKSNSYKELKINPDLETKSVSEKIKNKNTFKFFKNNKFFENYSTKEINYIIDKFYNKSIIDPIIYKIYYKKDIDIDFSKLIMNNVIYYYKLINFKILNVIIYNFDNLYGIISYYNSHKMRLTLVDTYIEMLMYLYKLELDMKLNPKLSKIVNYPLLFTNLLKHSELNIYYNSFLLYWK
jgi:hypothetical protein